MQPKIHCFAQTTAIILLGCLPYLAANSQEVANDDVDHWSLAPFLGTGVYQFDSEKTVFIFEYTPSWTLRTGSEHSEYPRRANVEFLLPAAMGLSSLDLDDLPNTLNPGNVATVSVVPGIQARLEMSPQWTLLASGNLGLGARLDGEEAALIYRMGLRSRYGIGAPEHRWNLIAGIDYIGFNSDTGRDGSSLPLTLSIELELAIDAWATDSGPTYLVSHITGSHYLDALTFSALEDAGATISNDLEIGFAVKPSARIKLWKLSWERIGIAYRRGKGDRGERSSKFEGLRLYFTSVFHQ